MAYPTYPRRVTHTHQKKMIDLVGEDSIIHGRKVGLFELITALETPDIQKEIVRGHVNEKTIKQVMPVMSLEFRHPPFLPFIAFLALPQYCLSSPMTTVPCDLLRSHRMTSACLWLRLHRLETLIGYTPMYRTTIPVLAHIKLHHSIGKPCDRPLMS